MSWNNLKAGVNAIVKANGNQEITGTNMQNVLGTIIDSLGANATFAGVATPTTVPGTPDGPVFYLAGQHGRYSNFGNVRFDTSNAIAIFAWDGSAWSKLELEFTVEGGGGGGGGGGGTDIDPSIATFTSSKVTIKVPLEVWDEATLATAFISSLYVGDDEIDVEGMLLLTYGKLEHVSIMESSQTGDDIFDIDAEVLVEDDMTIMGTLSVDTDIEIDGVSVSDSLTALNSKTAGISRETRTSGGVSHTITVINDNVEVNNLTAIGGIELESGTTGLFTNDNSIYMEGGSINMTGANGDILVEGGSITVARPSGSIYGGDIHVNGGGTIYIGNIDLSAKMSDLESLVNAIKNAQGEEVGAATTTAIGAGVLIWHNGNLYKTNSPIPSGTVWANMDVVPTTISAEINTLRGVAVESVVLNITPTSAIPQAGVKARIYNVTTQTYMPEVTFTPNFNRALLGVVNHGDVYTIIMPSIEGYTKPGDETFQANQMLRDRTVEYISGEYQGVEVVTLRAKKSDNQDIGSPTATFTLYAADGTLINTITRTLTSGVAEDVTIPLGTKYRIAFSDISGYLSPKEMIFTAVLSQRPLSGTYIKIPGNDIMIVTTDFEYLTADIDLTDYIAQNKLLGIAFLNSTLLTNNAAFIYVAWQRSIGGHNNMLSSERGPAKCWSDPIVDSPNSSYTYDGQSNTVNAYQSILAYEEANDVTVSSMFKDLYNDSRSVMEVNNIEYRYFILTRTQTMMIDNYKTEIANLFSYYGISLTPVGLTLGDNYSRQMSATENESQGANNKVVKNQLGYGGYKRVALPIINLT